MVCLNYDIIVSKQFNTPKAVLEDEVPSLRVQILKTPFLDPIKLTVPTNSSLIKDPTPGKCHSGAQINKCYLKKIVVWVISIHILLKTSKYSYPSPFRPSASYHSSSLASIPSSFIFLHTPPSLL